MTNKFSVQQAEVIEYTGTIESYNQMVADLKLDDLLDGVIHLNGFLTEDGNFTNVFTGIVRVAKKGLIMRPGCHYIKEIE